MNVRVRNLQSEDNYWNSIREAAACLGNGGLVVFPTETVYGLAAKATDREAIGRLRKVKQRPVEKPFTVHIGSRSTVERFIREPSGLEKRFIEKAWPGPLTLIFTVEHPEQAAVIQESSADHIASMYHEGTIGIRCPDDRVAADLLSEIKVPVVAASANPAGAGAPVEADQALELLGDQADYVLDNGPTRYRKASTIVRINAHEYEILREGVLDERSISRLAKLNFLVICSGNTCRSPMAEGLLCRLLADKLNCRESELADKGYYVKSAGSAAMSGLPPSEGAVKALQQRGIDISGHRSQPVTVEEINRADYIYTMTWRHIEDIARMVPSARGRTKCLNEADIEDPIGGSDEAYRECSDHIEKALFDRLKEVVF
jgi:L-threonylcarbamoyladenylate synthase